MGSDVELFAFAGAVPQFKSFLAIGLGQFRLLHVVVHRAETRIAHGKHGVEFDGALVIRKGTDFISHVVLAVSHAERLECVERRGRRLGERHVIFLNR